MKLYIMSWQESEDEYSLAVNLRRLYQLQLAVNFSDNRLFTDLLGILNDYSNLEDEVMYAFSFQFYAWSFYQILLMQVAKYVLASISSFCWIFITFYKVYPYHLRIIRWLYIYIFFFQFRFSLKIKLCDTSGDTFGVVERVPTSGVGFEVDWSRQSWWKFCEGSGHKEKQIYGAVAERTSISSRELGTGRCSLHLDLHCMPS